MTWKRTTSCVYVFLSCQINEKKLSFQPCRSEPQIVIHEALFKIKFHTCNTNKKNTRTEVHKIVENKLLDIFYLFLYRYFPLLSFPLAPSCGKTLVLHFQSDSKHHCSVINTFYFHILPFVSVKFLTVHLVFCTGTQVLITERKWVWNTQIKDSLKPHFFQFWFELMFYIMESSIKIHVNLHFNSKRTFISIFLKKSAW